MANHKKMPSSIDAATALLHKIFDRNSTVHDNVVSLGQLTEIASVWGRVPVCACSLAGQ